MEFSVPCFLRLGILTWISSPLRIVKNILYINIGGFTISSVGYSNVFGFLHAKASTGTHTQRSFIFSCIYNCMHSGYKVDITCSYY